jgi:DNA-binding NarL/FixJ family response regulator
VIRLVVAGYSNDEIAARLVVSRKTVEFHLTNLYSRYRLAGRVALALHATTAKWD